MQKDLVKIRQSYAEVSLDRILSSRMWWNVAVQVQCRCTANAVQTQCERSGNPSKVARGCIVVFYRVRRLPLLLVTDVTSFPSACSETLICDACTHIP